METINMQLLSAHRVGNKLKGEDLLLSASSIPHFEEWNALETFFTKSFKDEALYRFTFPGNYLHLNPVYAYVQEIFDNISSFHDKSIAIARYLYEKTTHPNIKSGDVYVVFFETCEVEGELVEAIGIFKTESQEKFLQLENNAGIFNAQIKKGVLLQHVDKGVLIYNINGDDGYLCKVVDAASRQEAHFWMQEFLNVEACENAYHQTKEMMKLTKSFVEETFPAVLGLDKPQQIEALNKSAMYFKEKEVFKEEDFVSEVFNDDAGVISTFKEYKAKAIEEMQIGSFDEFDISEKAVKKESKIFKSILKLDKNFHIYIHGDRSKIEKGRDDDGRKFYKIFYEEES